MNILVDKVGEPSQPPLDAIKWEGLIQDCDKLKELIRTKRDK